MRHIESFTVQDLFCIPIGHSKRLAEKKPGMGFGNYWRRETKWISCRSLPGAYVDNAGSVWFHSRWGDTGTVVRFEMKYVPPARGTAVNFKGFFERDAEIEIAEIETLKVLLERGNS